MAIFTRALSTRRDTSWDEYSSSLGESLYQTGREALIRSPALSIVNFLELAGANEPGGEPTPEEAMFGVQPTPPKTVIDAPTARQRVKELNLQLEIPDRGINEDALNILIERKQDETRRFDIIDRGPQGVLPGVAKFGTAFAASVLDPLNVATAFVPVVNAYRYHQMLSSATSAAARAGVRARVGALEGLAGAALVEPIIYGSARYEQADYDMLDSAINIGFGGVLGGGLHVIGGTGADFYRSRRSIPDPFKRLNGLSVDQIRQVYDLDARIAAGDLTADELVQIATNYPPSVLRAAGLIRNQADIDRQDAEVRAPLGTVFGENTQVRIGQTDVPARYAVVDLVDIEATMTKADNQWRDRTRRASDAQIREIANNPDYNQLQWSPVMDYGAPTLSTDGLIIGGNGRVMGISTSYEIGKAGSYRSRLMADMERFGIDPASIDTMKKPMLVRVLSQKVDVKKAAIISNEGGAARMSALEQAGVDADRLGDFRNFDIPDNGDLNTAGNRGAIKQWVGQFPTNQQAGLLTSEGYLSKEGLLRLRNAILFRAYGDTPVLKRLVESTDDVSANISTALIRAAGAIADARARIATGNLYDLDISGDIQVAVSKLGELRSKGMTFDDFEAQGDLLGLDITPEQLLLMRFMDDNIRSARAMASFINEYYAALDRAGDPNQADMFGGEPPTKSQLLEEALDAIENDPSAAAKIQRVSSATREAALRVSVGQLAEGRQVEVDPVLDSDPAIDTATPESTLARAKDSQSPQALITSDPEASARVSQSAPVTDAQKALDDAVNLAADVASRGNEAYKYSRDAGVDEIGFYSALQRTVDNLQQKKGSGEQFLAQISKTPGVKPDEIKWTGLDDFLANRKSVTKEEIQEFLARNRVEISETTLTGASEPDYSRIQIDWRNGDVIDDFEYINSRAEDILYSEEDYLPGVRDELRKEYIASRDLAEEDLQNDAIVERMESDVSDAMYERAQEFAEQEYYEDPYYRWTNEEGYEVSGNDDVGYVIHDPRGKNITPNRGAYDQEVVDQVIQDDAFSQGLLEAEGDSKFSDWTLPGGENYREVLMTLPRREGVGDYESGHFDQLNILAHFRTKDRVDADGKRMLFVEEIQSDWHQEGRKKGYETQEAKLRAKEIDKEFSVLLSRERELNEQRSDAVAQKNQEKISEIDSQIAEIRRNQTSLIQESKRLGRVPDAPFKTTWHELAVKRIIRMASEEGYERIGFTTGAIQAERYNLSRQVLSIDWSQYQDRGAEKLVTVYPKSGNPIELPITKEGTVSSTAGTQFDGKRLDEIIGKDIAKQIIEQNDGSLSGQGLAIGGEGMRGFYDNILPKFLNKYGKKWDAEVGKTEIKTDPGKTEPIWKIDITDKMKEAALTEGQPMFARGKKSVNAENIYQVVAESFGASTQRLLDVGGIRIVNDVSEIPGGPYYEDAKGITMPDGTVYIVARNVDPANVRGLVLHEVGEHVGMETMLGSKLYNDLQRQFEKGLARGESAFLRAAARVPSETLPEHVASERLAYLIENAPELKLVQKILAAIRAWAYRTFKFVQNNIELTEDDIRALAVSSLHSVARKSRAAQDGTVRYSRAADQVTDMDAELRIFDEAIEKAEAYGRAIRAAAERLGDPQAARSAMAQAGNFAQSEIDDLLDQLQKQNTAVRSRLRKVRESVTAEDRAAGMQSEAMQAANELSDRLVQAAVIEKRNAALNLAAKMKALSFVQSEFAGFEAEGFKALLAGSEMRRRGARASVQAEQAQMLGGWMGGIINDMNAAGLWDLFVSETMARETSRAMFRMGDPDANMADLPKEAVEMARIISKYQDDALYTQNRFGSWIRDMRGYIVRQSHDAYRIMKTGYQEWRDFVLPRLDTERTFRNGENIEEFLKQAYDDFAAGSHMKYNPDDETAAAFRGQGRSVAKAVSQSRVLHFKDGDAWFDYNERFGSQKLADAVLGGLEKASRSAGIMKILGINPEATLTRLLDEVEDNLRGDPKARSKFHQEREAIMNLFRHVDGSINMPGSHLAAQIGSGVRVFQSTAKLGGAVISSVPDLAVYASEQQFQGRGFLSGMGNALADLLRGRGAAEQQAIMNNTGVFFESMRNNVLRRFDTEQNIGGAMSALQTKFFKWNGLTWWTEVLRKSAALSLASDIGNSRMFAFSELRPEMQNILGLYKIDAGKWDLIRMGAAEEADGRVYITAESIKTVPRQALENYIQSVGRQVNDASVANLVQDIQGAMRSMFIDRAEHAVIEPDARTRAFWLRGTRPGTVWGETARFIAQFKSFPAAILQRTISREIYGRGYDTLSDYLKNGKGDMLGLVNLMAWMTLLGYGAMSIKDLLKGRTPRDPMSPSTWAAAMLQGGAMGIYGDFLFGEMKNRFGGGFLATVAGPTFGTIDDIADLYGRLRDGDDAAAKAFRLLISNTPFANLFYTRMALDYLFLYRIQEWLNPGYLRRMERRIERENDQTFLISPSDVIR
jgi:ribosomal protein S20